MAKKKRPTASGTGPGFQPPTTVSTGGQWLKAWQRLNPGMLAPGITLEAAQQAVPGFNPAALNDPSADPAWLVALIRQRAGGGGGGAAAAPAAGEDQTPFAGDAQYFAELARRQFDVSQKKAQLAQQGAYERTDLNEAMRRMVIKQQGDELSTKERANKQGLFFSGHLGKSLGDIGVAYGRARGDAEQTFARNQAAREAASAALDQGYTLDQASGLAASAERKIAADNEAALGGYLARDSGATTPAAPGVYDGRGPRQPAAKRQTLATTGFNKKRNQHFRVINRGGQIFHTYAGGRPVRVG